MKICDLGKNARHIPFNMIMWFYYFLIELYLANAWQLSLLILQEDILQCKKS